MRLWRMLVRVFSFGPPPKRDPAVQVVTAESKAKADETRELINRIRETAEKRRLATARRNYEDRQHGTFPR